MKSIAGLQIFLVGVMIFVAARIIFAFIFGKIKSRGKWRVRGVDESFEFVVKIEIGAFLILLMPVSYVILNFLTIPALWVQYAVLAEILIVIASAVGFIFAARKREKRRDAEIVQAKILEQMNFRKPK